MAEAYRLGSNDPYPLYKVCQSYTRKWISDFLHFNEPKNEQFSLLQQSSHSWQQGVNRKTLPCSFPMLWSASASSTPYFITYSIQLLKWHLNTFALAFNKVHRSWTQEETQKSSGQNNVWIKESPLQLITLSNSATPYVCELSDLFHNTNTNHREDNKLKTSAKYTDLCHPESCQMLDSCWILFSYSTEF